MTAACLSLWLQFGRWLLLYVLLNDEHARPSMPTDEEIAVFVNSISSKYPALRNCWGAVDGLKLRLEKSGDNKMQNIFLNGWTHDRHVCNLFCFLLMGKYGHAISTVPEQCMTPLWQIGAAFTRNWMICMKPQEQKLLSIQLLRRRIVNLFRNCTSPTLIIVDTSDKIWRCRGKQLQLGRWQSGA
jgi:hypothetical protein